jgi:serine/threonine-protein kinase HipA
MNATCRACLQPDPDGEYHTRCLKRLFRTSRCPSVDLQASTVAGVIAAQANKISISGVQQKVLMDLTADRLTLRPVETGWTYILKPQVEGHRHLPENEHLTMCLASLAGLEVPPVGLVSLKDETTAYVVKRFDRTDDAPPLKVQQEDFCSLLRKQPDDKYDATAEDCAEVVKQFAGDPEKSLRRLYQLFVFSFWTSNGDLHLKNLSLRENSSRAYELSPAYDLLSICLYPQLTQGEEALALNNKKAQLSRSDFLAFGACCGLAPADSGRLIDTMLDRHAEAREMVGRSALPRDFQRLYQHWLEKKRSALSGSGAKRVRTKRL